MKKTLALLLASASVLTLALTACGGNGTSSGNAASGGVMKRCGMKYEGTMRQVDRNNQGICDLSFYAVLASDRR